ncbi:hypothetical protein FKM82_029199 [Ascaphus truei]
MSPASFVSGRSRSIRKEVDVLFFRSVIGDRVIVTAIAGEGARGAQPGVKIRLNHIFFFKEADYTGEKLFFFPPPDSLNPVNAARSDRMMPTG